MEFSDEKPPNRTSANGMMTTEPEYVRANSVAESAAEKQGDHIYDVRARKGLALFFVNTEFVTDSLVDRPGGNVECYGQLRKMLQSRGIECIYKTNLSADGIREVIDELETPELETKQDLLLVFISSHGAFGRLYGTDGSKDPLSVREVTEKLGRRPELEKVPKFFVIQCCQNFDADNRRPEQLRQVDLLPEISNMHVEYTTLPGNYDFDYVEAGSVYMNAFVRSLDKHADSRPLQDIFQHTRKVLRDTPMAYKKSFVKLCPLTFHTLYSPIFLPGLRQRRGTAKPYASVSANGASIARTHEERLEDMPFFHHVADDKEVKLILKSVRDQPGHFLLRHSRRQANSYTFIITAKDRKLVKLQLRLDISRSGKQVWSIADQVFPRFSDLVDYYSKKHIPLDNDRDDLFLLYPVHRQETQEKDHHL